MSAAYAMPPLWLAMASCWYSTLTVPMRKSRVHLLRMLGDLCGASIGALGLISGVPAAVSLTAVLIGVPLAAFEYSQYRKHRDDDDDWGKRLKSWARSHIPRPTIVQLRPQAGEA